ncbi:MAG: hypothetical protein LBF12_02330 [Christensenellaceae bacterium]|jgi:hypothetical protein|nr:hypothetical protein [Christensenellaceae bacterium]
MKKILEKIVSVTLAFISLLFVIMMLVVMFNPEYAQNMDNSLVNVLIIIFACIYAILSGINIARAFTDSEKINSILLFKGKDSATKASITVVKKTARGATAQIEGAKLKKAVLYVDENNDVRMKVDLKITDDDVDKIVNCVRANIITTFDEVLGFRFKAIDFNVTNLKNPQYKPSPERVKEEQTKFLKEQAEIKAIADAKNKANEEIQEKTCSEVETIEEISTEATQEILSEGEPSVILTASLEEDDVTPPGVVTTNEDIIESEDYALEDQSIESEDLPNDPDTGSNENVTETDSVND